MPFLDHPLVELLARMPPQMKLNGLNEKYILKQCMTPRLPQVPHAFKKRGFYTPISAWFFTPERMRELEPYLSREAIINADIFDPGRVAELQVALQRSAKPADMHAAYTYTQIEWALFTVFTTQILHALYIGKSAFQSARQSEYRAQTI